MPKLTIIAGCNGSGKSTFAKSFLTSDVASFDYDKLYLKNYDSLLDSDFREEMAKNMTTTAFENAANDAIQSKTDFCYETNFDTHPIYWAEKFREAGFTLNLIFFCLERQEIARKRIEVRTENKGHFVNNKTIDFKWKAGYKNANLYYGFFDNVLIVDNSKHNEIFTNLVQIEQGRVELMTNQLPTYFGHRFPSISKMINAQN
ncbi:MAG: zeta toxin family protein [Flavobacteriales bacterium]|jgi:predicted ABC-type ATPase|nr:zeta toxin family protein [Flavobacteriales bacterium]